MPGLIEFGNSCACENACRGEVCWRPAQRELTQILDAWRLRNPSSSYHVASDAPRHHGQSFSWDPRKRELWDVVAAPGSWRQTYAVGEEQILIRQVVAGEIEESFTVEPTLRSVPDRVRVVRQAAVMT